MTIALSVAVMLLAALGQQLLPQSDEERQELAAAVRAVRPQARGWTLRRSDANWIMAGTDRVVWVDFPAATVVGRVGWHRSSHCTRRAEDLTWECSPQGKKALLEVRPLVSPEAEAGACPTTTVRGIRIARTVPLEAVPRLLDYARFSAAGSIAIDAMCRPPLEHWEYPKLEWCDVAAIEVGDNGTFDLSLRIASSHWAVLSLAHECDESGCATRLIDCRDGPMG